MDAVKPFPDEHALCEACGYPLKQLAREACCPECGKPVAESDPDTRAGLPFQRRMTPRTAAAATLRLFRPRRAFDSLSLRTPLARDLVYLLIWANLAGAAAALMSDADRRLWLVYVVGTKLVLLAVFVEAAGVAFFAARRGWRVPLTAALRVCCFASPAWILAGLALPPFFDAMASGRIDLPRRLPYGLDPVLLPMLVVLVAGAVVMFAFETLVWIGVGRIRYANR